MSEQEQTAFRAVYAFYDRWRETVIETDEEWTRFAKDASETSRALDENLGWRLLLAAIDAINDLYRGGKKPEAVGYLGRADL